MNMDLEADGVGCGEGQDVKVEEVAFGESDDVMYVTQDEWDQYSATEKSLLLTLAQIRGEPLSISKDSVGMKRARHQK